MVDVVAALIWREGCFLACRRAANKARALLWEFPGGKVEAGETPQQALARECREELAVDLAVGGLFCQTVHAYPDITVRLSVYTAAIAWGQPQLLEHKEIRWVAPQEMDGMVFCPADGPVLQRIRAVYLQGGLADLHLHSCYSDGTDSPQTIARLAYDAGIRLISLTDHNTIDGTAQMRAACGALGMGFIPGVELDTVWENMDVHTLCYGADEQNAAFANAVAENSRLLLAISDCLIQRLHEDYPAASLQGYRDFPECRTQGAWTGGWKALQYLLSLGVVANVGEALALYGRYGCTYATAGFPTTAQWIEIIHQAGGKAILAHPGETLRSVAPQDFGATVVRLMDEGLDGIECYYPSHTPQQTQACLSICRARGLLVTAGSDSHGSFGSRALGQDGILIKDLILDGLVIDRKPFLPGAEK